MRQEPSDLPYFIRACAAGDGDARRQFQDTYGEDIYNFPVKIYGAPLEDAGEFYVYVFEDDRIFTRIRSFEGRNSIQFRTFLSYYVLKHLFLEWRRGQKELDTISLHTPLRGEESDGELEDVFSGSLGIEVEITEVAARGTSTEIWQLLSPEERLDVKLLSLLECDLNPDDIRVLAQIAKRSIIDTLALVDEVQARLKRKDEKLSRLRDDLDSAWGWIVLRQKELQEIHEKIHLLSMHEDLAGRAKLLLQQETVEHALAKRLRQREKIIEAMRTYKMTTPYKDMAQLLNLTVGAVCSRVFRLRERLVGEFGGQWALEEHAQ